MPKPRSLGGQTCPKAFQSALDELDVIGQWEWDAATDCARSDAFVALLFDVDPQQAEAGVPLTQYVEAIHPEDRVRVLDLIRRSAGEGSTFLTEYRVISVDRQTRWVLARGRFTADHQGRPVGGGGILVDITSLRMSEGTFAEGTRRPDETALDRAADRAIAAQQAIVELRDPALKALADALLISLGRKLAQQEVQDRRRKMN
ncbi:MULTISPECIES: PAS domain-containing protein [Methylobacterium]|uniref:PAS domain-containing protein n=1 Tax=Methylobacterium TaxID=407 RepID=UPI000347018F|nr:MULTISPECIES: PAS domain-containing protein [Methylobacterium]MBN4093528.1 PAS domain-containing protein [Methylobacterium sp. OT2]UIN34086.1 PAS domain-containing protein [Methylobacterium oryzae]SEF58513.1 PAS fold-containing protein [Methylobacterium sp. 190mf]